VINYLFIHDDAERIKFQFSCALSPFFPLQINTYDKYDSNTA